MDFLEPSSIPPLPTYHVMSSVEGKGLDFTNEQALEWYKNMLTGTSRKVKKYN